MPLYALNEKKWVHATDANPSKRYECPECHRPVRIKKGAYRLPHFYHLRKSPHCRLYSKTKDHYILQKQIQEKILFSHSIELEKQFPEIQRIADLVWEEKKIIIEIQCSQISLTEVQERIKDYATLGYQILWLLDDRLFNQKIAGPAEQFLRGLHCYFFSFQRQNQSLIYDQCEFFLKKKRVKKSLKSKVELSKLHFIPEITWPEKLPKQLELRLKNCQTYHLGDLIHKLLLSFQSSALELFFTNWQKEELLLKKNGWNSFFHFIKKNLITPYQKWLIDRFKRKID